MEPHCTRLEELTGLVNQVFNTKCARNKYFRSAATILETRIQWGKHAPITPGTTPRHYFRSAPAIEKMVYIDWISLSHNSSRKHLAGVIRHQIQSGEVGPIVFDGKITW